MSATECNKMGRRIPSATHHCSSARSKSSAGKGWVSCNGAIFRYHFGMTCFIPRLLHDWKCWLPCAIFSNIEHTLPGQCIRRNDRYKHVKQWSPSSAILGYKTHFKLTSYICWSITGSLVPPSKDWTWYILVCFFFASCRHIIILF